jgi:hypothetical protein
MIFNIETNTSLFFHSHRIKYYLKSLKKSVFLTYRLYYSIAFRAIYIQIVIMKDKFHILKHNSIF